MCLFLHTHLVQQPKKMWFMNPSRSLVCVWVEFYHSFFFETFFRERCENQFSTFIFFVTKKFILNIITTHREVYRSWSVFCQVCFCCQLLLLFSFHSLNQVSLRLLNWEYILHFWYLKKKNRKNVSRFILLKKILFPLTRPDWNHPTLCIHPPATAAAAAWNTRSKAIFRNFFFTTTTNTAAAAQDHVSVNSRKKSYWQ